MTDRQEAQGNSLLTSGASDDNVMMDLYQEAESNSQYTSGASDEIAMTDLYQEVRTVIESWAKGLDKKLSTEAEKAALNDAILNLHMREENTRAFTKADERDQEISTKSDTSGVRPADTTPNTGKPRTLLELIDYILNVFTEERLKELKFQISVVMTDHMKQMYGVATTKGTLNFLLVFESLASFSISLGLYRNTVQTVHLVNSTYHGDEDSIQLAYKDIQVLLCAADVLVSRINSLTSPPEPGEKVLKWDEKLVQPTNEDDLTRITFCRDASKASALIVSGESGSGKTWFCQKYIPNRLGEQDLALIYFSVEEGDGQSCIKSNDTLLPHLKACGNAMRYLRMKKQSHGKVHQCLSHLAMVYNKGRDKSAYSWLKARLSYTLSPDEVVYQWWHSPDKSKFKPIKKLVLVIDEIGKNPELARALVSIVREVYRDIIHKGLAEQVLLVLAGSGLERHIDDDYVSLFEVDQGKNTTFGTDPMKAEIIILRGPDLTREEIFKIPTTSLLKGTYSRILSTNTRMLTRGVLPMMKVKELTEHVPETQLSAWYEALGSSNLVMDYAARNYIALNGLAKMKLEMDELQEVLLTQFKILLHERLVHLKQNNPACDHISESLEIKMPSDLDKVSLLGLVTADVRTTSPALRYLACNGKTAPLDAQDGIGFELMVQYHLVRLCEASNKNVGFSHWVGQYNLSQAWPPFSNKGDENLTDREITKSTVDKRYEGTHGSSDDDLEDGEEDDISAIKDLLKDKMDFDLVLRQKVSNAQGPDLMILSRNNQKIVLHLFQCKNVKTIPGKNSKKLVEYFWSLGVQIDKEGGNINIVPESGSAGYSYVGIQHFAMKLGDAIGTEVKIGTRILVLSKEWDEKLGTDFLKRAKEKEVMVWTREMLEPTISALPTKARKMTG